MELAVKRSVGQEMGVCRIVWCAKAMESTVQCSVGQGLGVCRLVQKDRISRIVKCAKNDGISSIV